MNLEKLSRLAVFTLHLVQWKTCSMAFGFRQTCRYSGNAMNAHITVLGAQSHLPPKSQEPAATEAFFCTILRTLPLGVCWQKCGEDGNCWVNKSFARLVGQPGETFPGIDCFANSLH